MYTTVQQRFRQEIEQLYGRLPHVACTGCGICCVSPTCTLAEFIYFLVYCTHNLNSERFTQQLLTPPEVHVGYEGNTVCLYLDEGRCSVHPGRTGACRLFGIPAVDQMNIPGLVTCSKKTSAASQEFSSGNVKAWLVDLVRLNRKLYPMGEAPYFLTGLTLECWYDVYYYEYWKQPFFRKLHDILHLHVKLPGTIPYLQRTAIVEKVAAIDRFFTIIDSGNAGAMVPLLLHIRDDFPLTGTWYHAEAQRFLDAFADAVPEEVSLAAVGKT